MTLEELQAIRERLNSITPWPWERRNSTDVFTVLGATNRAGVTADSLDAWQIARCDTGRTTTTDDGDERELLLAEEIANAEFIANAPADIERLLDEVERLRGALERILHESKYLPVQNLDDDDERELALVNKVFDIQRIARKALEGGDAA